MQQARLVGREVWVRQGSPWGPVWRLVAVLEGEARETPFRRLWSRLASSL